MEKDVKCPYCQQEQDIRYTEDLRNDDMCEQQCENDNCKKYFSYEVHITVSYTPYTLDCANSEVDIHKWQDSKYLSDWQTCADCGEGRTKKN